MSRRSRRRKAAGESRWLGKAAVGLLVVALLGLGVAYAALRGYLHSEAFRKFLSAEASGMAGVKGEFKPFIWDGLTVSTDSFEATGAGFVAAMRADGLHTEVGFGGLRRGVWEIRGSNIRRLDISLDATRPDAAEAPIEFKISKPQSSNSSSWLPRKAELQEFDVQAVTVKAVLKQGLAVAGGMSVHAERVGGKDRYQGDVEGGQIRLPFPFLPELRLDRLHLRYQDDQVFLTQATVSAWETGRIEGTGEWDMNSRQFSLQGDARGMKCENLVNANWAKRLTGEAVSNFTVDNHSGQLMAGGTLTIHDGVLTALPILDSLAAYADTRRFRVMTLNEVRTKWRWKPGEISLSDLVLSSEGLARLEGSLSIRGERLDGLFRLGLAPGTLSNIPGAETDVFLPGERGLLWTTLRITGTLDDPKEDLTDRLIAAAGMRMFDVIPETGEKVIKFTRSVIGENPSKAVDQGLKIIDEGTKAVRGAGDILNGILGNEPADPDKEEH